MRPTKPSLSLFGSALVLAALMVSCPAPLVAQTASPAPVYRWTTLAGLATTGFDDGPGTGARFNNPHGVALDAAGNVYVADTANHTIRKITRQGAVSTFAGAPNQPGSADGPAAAARFLLPEGVAVDASGNVYVADTGNSTIRKITPEGTVTTLAGLAGQAGTVDGPAATARFTRPSRIFADANGQVWVVDSGVRRIANGTVNTLSLAGSVTTGRGESLAVDTLAVRGVIAVDSAGQVYLPVGAPQSQFAWKRILKRDVAGNYSIMASSELSDNRPFISTQTTEVAMATDAGGNLYFVSQLISSVVDYSATKITPAGTASRATWRTLNRGSLADAPQGFAVDASERIVSTNTWDDVVLESTPQGAGVLAGIPWSDRGADGRGPAARFAQIAGLALDRAGQVLVADSEKIYSFFYSGRATLRRVSPTGESTALYGGQFTPSPTQVATGVALGASDNVILGLTGPVAEFRQISPTGTVTSFERDGFFYLTAMGSDSAGRLVVAGVDRRLYRRAVTGEWTILAGANENPEIRDGTGPDARFSEILSLSVAANGDVYLLDRASEPTARVVVRRVQPTGTVTTLTSNLAKSANVRPASIAIDAKSDFLLAYTDDTLRLLNAGGEEWVIGGTTGEGGFRDGDGQAARFYQPGALVADAQNTLYVADNAGVAIRKGEFLGYLSTITRQPQSATVGAGGSVTFSVTASGTPAPAYQWQFNGTPIPGATSSSLSLANVSAANAGTYTVVVANMLGSVTSNPATLTVNAPPPSPGPSGQAGGGGGGGAPSIWFLMALLALGTARARTARR